MATNINQTEEQKLLQEDLEHARLQSSELVELFCSIRSDELREHMLKLFRIMTGLYQGTR